MTASGPAGRQLRPPFAQDQPPRYLEGYSLHCPDPQVRELLGQVIREVPSASHITLHRALDIIAWRKRQGHCCDTQARA
jgi:hypothetical protein